LLTSAERVCVYRGVEEGLRWLLIWLHLVPLWYLAQLCTGMLLFSAPSRPSEMGEFMMTLGVVAVLFAGITWLNRCAAVKIEESALALRA